MKDICVGGWGKSEGSGEGSGKNWGRETIIRVYCTKNVFSVKTKHCFQYLVTEKKLIRSEVRS